MDTQIVNSKKDNSWITKLLIALGIGGGAWLLFSSFKSSDDTPLPDPGDMNPDTAADSEESIALRSYGILVSGTDWSNQLVIRALANKTLFATELYNAALALWIEKGEETNAQIITQFENKIKYESYLIEKSSGWVDAVNALATEIGISYAAALRKSAIWVIIHNLSKGWELKVTAGSNKPNDNPVSGVSRLNQTSY